MKKICKTCNIEFETKRSHTQFCSRLCYRRYPENAKKYSRRTSEYQKKHSQEPKRRLDKLKHKCNSNNLELIIDLEQYTKLLNSGCFYCEAGLLTETGCSLDRLDNSGGYTIENVVPCCGKCNQIRNVHLTHEEMKIAMQAILNFRKGE